MNQEHRVRDRRLKSLPVAPVNNLRRFAFGLYGLPGEVAPGADLQPCFLLGHMRAGSSLLMKLISTSPEILENGELMLNYGSRLDLTVMKGRLLYRNKRLLPSSEHVIALDKLLHNYQLPLENLDLVIEHNIKIIILFRSPARTISSIVTNFKKYPVERATDYYIERLNMLSAYAARLGPEIELVGLEYDHMVEHSESLFRMLEDYLGLRNQLREEYDMHAGHYGRADPSDNLKSGRILPSTETRPADENIPAELMERAEVAYQQCRTSVLANCRTVGP